MNHAEYVAQINFFKQMFKVCTRKINTSCYLVKRNMVELTQKDMNISHFNIPLSRFLIWTI